MERLQDFLAAESVEDLDRQELNEKEIGELYTEIHEKLDAVGVIDKLRGNVAFRVALIGGWMKALKKFKDVSGRTADYQEINLAVLEAEGEFVGKLEKLGVRTEVRSEISAEELRGRAYLFMSTHQGGGLETYVLADLMKRAGVDQYRYVVKDDLIKMPLVGKVIKGRGPILVSRKNLSESKYRENEVHRIAVEIVESLSRGENVLFFFEGTRSKSGEIAHTEKRKAWCYELMGEVDEVLLDYPGLDYGRALVVLDMLSVMPVAVEKSLTAPVRTNGDCTVQIVKADDLVLRENAENLYDGKTLFGKARAVLKESLVERLIKMQK
ncbi:MAG: lysophospholipid acyltransferase family protein [Candidatus Altimarinota bacterium]